MATKKSKPAKSAKPAEKPEAASAASAGNAGKMSARAALAVATSSRRSSEERVLAMTEGRLATSGKEDDLQSVLGVLVDPAEPRPVRLAALRTIQAASFSSPAFEALRGDYIAALRKVAQDPDPELRQRALGLLARERDGFAQKKLLEGLENPEKALVPPEKALQLLSYDVHSDAYPVARKIAGDPPNEAAKREALRLLAADAKAAPMFEKILRDKDEPAELRQLSASALHALRPERLQEQARNILLDDSEHEDIQATSLTALTQFGDGEALAGDEALMTRVGQIKDKASRKVKQSARQFLDKYGR